MNKSLTTMGEYKNDTFPKNIFIFFQNLDLYYKEKKLESEFFTLLYTIDLNLKIKSIYQGNFYGYLAFIYKMTTFTRDIEFGNGNLKCYLVLLWVWYNVCPFLGLNLIDAAYDSSKNLSFGSWKDLKYICEYVKQKTGSESNPLILHCINKYVSQLKKDEKLIKENKEISLIGKWVPREKSKYGWIFALIAKNYYYYFFTNVGSSPVNAENKAKTLLRKLLSRLNRKIGTLEMLQCENKIDEIKPECLTTKNLILQSNWLLNNISVKSLPREELKNRVLSYKNTKNCQIKDVIAKAWNYCELNKTDLIQESYVNKIWDNIISHIEDLIKIIPLLDCSFDMNENDFVAALGFALAISQRSVYKNRLVLCSNRYKWIIFGEDLKLIERIKLIRKHMNRVNSDLENCYTTLCKEIMNCKDKNDQIQNINFLLLTNGENINFLKKTNKYKPKLIIWLMSGMSKEKFSTNHSNYSIVSGKNSRYINFFWSKKCGFTPIVLTDEMFFIKFNMKFLNKPKFLKLDPIVSNWFSLTINHL